MAAFCSLSIAAILALAWMVASVSGDTHAHSSSQTQNFVIDAVGSIAAIIGVIGDPCLALNLWATIDAPLCRGFTHPNHTRHCISPGSVFSATALINTTGLSTVTVDAISLSVRTATNATIFNASSLALVNEQDLKFPLALQPTANITFAGPLSTAVDNVGVYDVLLEASVSLESVTCSLTQSIQLDITCSDGIFCNGDEKLVGSVCVSGPPPCDDHDNCTADDCDEEFGVCGHSLYNTTECFASSTCQSPRCLAQCPVDSQCGNDGCGGLCGTGCVSGWECKNYSCLPALGILTCALPGSILSSPSQSLLGSHEILIDLSAPNLGDQVWPACTLYGTMPDAIYEFTVPESFTNGVGIDARLHGRYNRELDTVLEFRQERCFDLPRTTITSGDATATPEQGKDFVCSNDSEPPGGESSRIVALIHPGHYFVVATINPIFEDRAIGNGSLYHTVFPSNLPSNHSDYQLRLELRFVDGYIQDCRQKECGADGRDPNGCGLCPSGQFCTDEFQCKKINCEPNCANRTCGDDGCGGSCGQCTQPFGACLVDSGQCIIDESHSCDGLRPKCSSVCTSEQFCGTDCRCHSLSEPLPDLIVKIEDLMDDLSLANLNFTSRSCAVKEKCISGAGEQRVLRFTVSVLNQGHADVVLLDPKLHPNSFVWSPCHQHYHYRTFAAYTLINTNTSVVSQEGHKQAFCLEDTKQELPGKHVPCLPRFNCTNPGIQRGWSDGYDATLDCQWVEVTGLEPGVYELRVEINTERMILESSYENNVAVIQVRLP